MALPSRTIVFFDYQREDNVIYPTSGGLRDATSAELEHPVGKSWLEELEDGEYRLSLAAQGFEIRPMDVAMEHVAKHNEEWEQMARAALQEHLPECELVPPRSANDSQATDSES